MIKSTQIMEGFRIEFEHEGKVLWDDVIMRPTRFISNGTILKIYRSFPDWDKPFVFFGSLALGLQLW